MKHLRLRRLAGSLGLVAIAVSSAGGLSGGSARAAGTTSPEPGVCQGCQPPLKFVPGPVLGTNGLTITPIYWQIPGTTAFPDPYMAVINQYLSDVAAASGSNSNVYAIATEYYQQGSDGSQQPIKYQFTAGAPVTVTDAPAQSANPCTPPAGGLFQVCVSQDQIQAELQTALSANNLPADAQHMYVLMFPNQVQSCEAGGCSGTQYCGVHQAFQTSAGGAVVYADQPYPVNGCTGGQAPNGDVAGDAQVSVISHEIMEAITDPSSPRTWNDAQGNEIGDECNFNFGPPVGSTDPNNPQSTEYNQAINGHFYWTQTEFSNASYVANGVGHGCVTTEGGATATVAPTAYRQTAASDASAHATMNLSNTDVPADGSSTVMATIEVDDSSGEPVSGAHIHFVVQNSDNTTNGLCGTLKSADAVTDDNGQATTTFTASKENVACLVIGIDAEDGASDFATVYQGTASDFEPGITDSSAPTSIGADGTTQTFTVTAQNPSKADIRDARFDVFLTGDGNGSTGLHDNQVHIAYSDANTNGSFVDLPLHGQTTKDGEIDGFVTDAKAETLAAGQSETVTFRVSLASGAPTSSTTGSPLHVEVDLDQFNPADSSTDNLDYVGPFDVTVTGSSGGGFPTWLIIVIVIAAILVLGGGGFAIRRRSAGRPA